MDKSISMSEILKLSIPERIQLVEDIWDSIAAVPEAIELTEAEKEELDRRFASMDANPDSCIPWEVVKRSILGRQ